jgi:hypothetical protein
MQFLKAEIYQQQINIQQRPQKALTLVKSNDKKLDGAEMKSCR